MEKMGFTCSYIRNKKNDQFTSKDYNKFCKTLFRKALDNDIATIGITDYFNIENYKKVREFVNSIDSTSGFTSDELKKIKRIFILPNVELRMLPVTDKGRLVNIHCIFNPKYVDSLENNFFSSIEYSAERGKKYKMNRQGLIDLGKNLDSSLDNEEAYQKGIESFVVTHSDLQKLLDENSGFRNNAIIAVSNSNQDGASAFQKHYDLFENVDSGSLDAVRRSIYKLSDCIFSSNKNDADYFVGQKIDDENDVKEKCGSLKPCIHGSDAHTEESLFCPDNNNFCWIKSDPTFEGLKQILYEPFPGERVKISSVIPDKKDDYKIISKIYFEDSSDFPDEIIFNQNLCSIIGSRSSGKSALLNYLAHSIDPEYTKIVTPGPGKGEKYHWNKIKKNYSVEWRNGLTNDKNQGKVLFVCQNYLFNKCMDSVEIKNKISPVLFRILPEFKMEHEKTEEGIISFNANIEKCVEKYFELSKSIIEHQVNIQDIGNKDPLLKEKQKIEKEINSNKIKNKINKTELSKYQRISSKISKNEKKIDEINYDLLQLKGISTTHPYVKEIDLSFSPLIDSLPTQVQSEIQNYLTGQKTIILMKVNEKIITFKKDLKKEKESLINENKTINNNNNKQLIEKYKKNLELEGLVEKSNELSLLISIVDKELIKIDNSKKGINKTIKKIKKILKDRYQLLEKLSINIRNSVQKAIDDISFTLEYDFNREELVSLEEQINTREKTEFVDKHQVIINNIRLNPESFLEAIFTEKQKINQGFNPIQVAKDLLKLTEQILFIAEMEGDTIGGFTESTMTQGKKALFLLRLILAESDDSWPLLVDQPEDDLDSRSLFDIIVPFLKEKKKERQIIMVSHDANLVIGADSDQVIVANRHGSDRINEDGLQFNYLLGSLENSEPLNSAIIDTLNSQGIREHACDILDGGETAFEKRMKKYNLGK